MLTPDHLSPTTNPPSQIRHHETPRIHPRHDRAPHRVILCHSKHSLQGYDSLVFAKPYDLSASSNTPIPPNPTPFPQPTQAPTYPYVETRLTQHPRQLDLRGRPRSHHGQRGSDRVHLRGDGRGPVGAAARAVKRRQEGPVRGLVWFSSWSCTHNIMYFLSMSQRFIHNNTWLESRMRAHRCWALFYLGVGWNCSASDA